MSLVSDLDWVVVEMHGNAGIDGRIASRTMVGQAHRVTRESVLAE